MILRPPRRAAEYFKSKDSGTAITEHFIRELIKNGDIPIIKSGAKQLVDCEYLEKYIHERLKP